ncbi:RNA annealing protein [Zymoseptoria brevis]|uniref:RNA annealing protein n=1 Tax=Zymoseptoria brevis TaxID=1047168 RepID=A0A0F4GY75_9PEZI|nr:RNA annealing protein [Zymoseptoria brevis]
MSGKLAQSLDTIMSENKTGNGGKRRGGRAPRKAAVKATAVIVGGVQKTRGGKNTTKAVAAAPLTGETKISVSNLPEDEYFSSTVAPVKKVVLNYGPTGRSRGSAVVSFNSANAGAKAVALDGTKVDGRPLRIEILVSAKAVRNVAPKSLQDRVSKPKNAAKPNGKETAAAKGAAAGVAKGGRAGKKAGRVNKPKKTAEELDAEMQDYFGGDSNGAATNGTAQPAATAATNGDTGMVDEVL